MARLSKTNARGQHIELVLARHFISDPTARWSALELRRLLFEDRIDRVYRALNRLIDHGLVVKIGTVYSLDAKLVGSLNGQRTQIRNRIKQLETIQYGSS